MRRLPILVIKTLDQPNETMETESYSGPLRRSYQLPALAALSCVAFGTGSLHASFLLVDWGGQYVANDQEFNGSYTNVDNIDLDNDSVADDSKFGYAYNALSPAPLSPSSGYSGTSGTFFGGFVINTLNNPSSLGESLQPNGQGVHQNGPNDHLKFQTQHSENHHHTFSLLTYWDKADFLNGGSGAYISLDTLSNFSLTIRNSTNVQDDIHLHFLIRQGNQFYTSEAFFGGTGASLLEPGRLGDIPDGGSAVFNPLANPTLGWKAYAPDGLNLQWQHGDWSPQNFDNITAVGYYFDTLNFTQNNSNLEITGFSFSAVPEPSSALIALGGFGTLLLRRRRP
jgi:hypothetical protein